MSNIIKVNVHIAAPDNITADYVAGYVNDAIASFGGGFDPQDEMFHAGRWPRTVRAVKVKPKQPRQRLIRVLVYEGEPEWLSNVLEKRGVKGSMQTFGDNIIREAIVGDFLEVFDKGANDESDAG